jgi:Lipid A 3-O-deacylase (PagL)
MIKGSVHTPARPVGVQVNLLRYRRFEPFLTGGGGFLYFNRLLFGATQLNFTARLGAGVQLLTSRRHAAIDLVYEYHQVSNANLGSRNVGMDSHMLFVGVSFLR